MRLKFFETLQRWPYNHFFWSRFEDRILTQFNGGSGYIHENRGVDPRWGVKKNPKNSPSDSCALSRPQVDEVIQRKCAWPCKDDVHKLTFTIVPKQWIKEKCAKKIDSTRSALVIFFINEIHAAGTCGTINAHFWL